MKLSSRTDRYQPEKTLQHLNSSGVYLIANAWAMLMLYCVVQGLSRFTSAWRELFHTP